MPDFRNTDEVNDDSFLDRPGNGSKEEIEALVVKAVRGDSDAYGVLYSLFVAKIYRYIFYQVRNKSFAEDITGEAFLKAWKAIGSCKGKESTFSAWLYRIAHNHMVDEIRKRQRHNSVEIDDADLIEDTTQKSGGFQQRQELLEEIGKLPDNQKQVIVLKFIEGLDNREIAGILKKSEGAVRVLQMRALNALKKRLG